jgi:SAM-dependent methyltransferase
MDEAAGRSDDRLSGTIALYSHLWTGQASVASDESSHVEQVEDTLEEPVVRGRIGLDAGSGHGADTLNMAARHPNVEVISLDISEGVYETRWRTKALPNVHVVRASVLSIPLRSGSCDFAYSFGVLHHTSDPKGGLAEIARTLKPGGLTALYLYEDHADNVWKAIPLKLVNGLRRITTGMNTRVLSGLCWLLSPVAFMTFTVPARIMGWFRRTRPVAEKMPFSFGTSPLSLHGDLFDRLGAPIEVRYGREELASLLASCGLVDIGITKFKVAAGWVARGVKAGA